MDDLPFGFPRWQGTSGDRVVRSTPAVDEVEDGDGGGEPSYKVWMPSWVS